MVDTSLPWWAFTLRGVLVYCVLLVLVLVLVHVRQAHMKKWRIAVSEVHQPLRKADAELAQVRCIFLEADGGITVLERKAPT